MVGTKSGTIESGEYTDVVGYKQDSDNAKLSFAESGPVIDRSLLDQSCGQVLQVGRSESLYE